jgi:hypothetical protein
MPFGKSNKTVNFLNEASKIKKLGERYAWSAVRFFSLNYHSSSIHSVGIDRIVGSRESCEAAKG